jgi:hypothetical protein
MVLYGYIHYTEGLESQFLELDDEDMDIIIRSMGNFLEAERERQNPGVLGIFSWLLMKKTVNACSGTQVLY